MERDFLECGIVFTVSSNLEGRSLIEFVGGVDRIGIQSRCLFGLERNIGYAGRIDN